MRRTDREIKDRDEIIDVLHCGYHGDIYDTAALRYMRIYKMALSSVTGKRRFV